MFRGILVLAISLCSALSSAAVTESEWKDSVKKTKFGAISKNLSAAGQTDLLSKVVKTLEPLNLEAFEMQLLTWAEDSQESYILRRISLYQIQRAQQPAWIFARILELADRASLNDRELADAAFSAISSYIGSSNSEAELLLQSHFANLHNSQLIAAYLEKRLFVFQNIETQIPLYMSHPDSRVRQAAFAYLIDLSLRNNRIASRDLAQQTAILLQNESEASIRIATLQALATSPRVEIAFAAWLPVVVQMKLKDPDSQAREAARRAAFSLRGGRSLKQSGIGVAVMGREERSFIHQGFQNLRAYAAGSLDLLASRKIDTASAPTATVAATRSCSSLFAL